MISFTVLPLTQISELASVSVPESVPVSAPESVSVSAPESVPVSAPVLGSGVGSGSGAGSGVGSGVTGVSVVLVEGGVSTTVVEVVTELLVEVDGV